MDYKIIISIPNLKFTVIVIISFNFTETIVLTGYGRDHGETPFMLEIDGGIERQK